MPVVKNARDRAHAATAVAEKLVPSNIGSMIDQLYTLREKKRELDEQINKIEGEYAAIEEALMEKLDSEGTTKSDGKLASAFITTSVVGTAEDWDAFNAFVKKKGFFHLYQRRLSDAALRELWDKGMTIPGISKFTKRKLNVRVL